MSVRTWCGELVGDGGPVCVEVLVAVAVAVGDDAMEAVAATTVGVEATLRVLDTPEDPESVSHPLEDCDAPGLSVPTTGLALAVRPWGEGVEPADAEEH